MKFTIPVKIKSVVVLFFFCWTFGGLFDIAYAFKNSDELRVTSKEKKTQNIQKPEGKFQKAIEDIDQILTDAVTDTDTKKNKAKVKKGEIESLDVEIRKQFRETEDKIKDLPEVIKQRHRDFVRKYEENLNILRTNLDDIEKAKTKTETDAEIEKTKAHLEKVKPPKKHIPLDPNKLPHRTAEPVFKEPRTSPEQFSLEQRAESKAPKKDSILVASTGPLDGLLSPNSEPSTSNLLVALANPASPADLAETIEVQFTPEIRAKAQELGYNPVKIYNWIRNNIEYVPTYGSIQGANMCLQTKL